MILSTPRVPFTLKILAGFAVLAFAGQAHAQGSEMNLGDVTPGSVKPLKLVGKNANCEAPQDFRVELSSEPWFRMSGPTVMSGIPAGGSQSTELLLDFANLPPGRYTGDVKINCESCGWWIFAACSANDQKVGIEFRIPKPSSNPGRYDSFTEAMNDVAAGTVNLQLGPPQWIEWDEENNGFVIPDLSGPDAPPQNPGQGDVPVPVPDPRNQNPVMPPINGGVIWVPPVIPHAGEPEKWPYPPSPIGGDVRYPRDAEFGGFAWDEWEPRIGLRYRQDDVDQPAVPGGKNANEPRIRIGARYTQDDADNVPPPPAQGAPAPKPDPKLDRNGDGKVDEIDAAIMFMEAYAMAKYGVPLEYLLPGGAGIIPPKAPNVPKSPARFLEGDLNGDGKIDNADLEKWLEDNKFTENPSPSEDKNKQEDFPIEAIGPPVIVPPSDDQVQSVPDDNGELSEQDIEKIIQDILDAIYLEEVMKYVAEQDGKNWPLPPKAPDPKSGGFGHDKNFTDGEPIIRPGEDGRGGPNGTTEPGDTYPSVPGDRDGDGKSDAKPKPKPKAVVFHPPADFENDMRGRDLEKLRNKRLDCIKKTAAVAAAQSELTDKANKATKCAKKLATLKAALDQAKAEQAGADQAAKNAADHAANYNADLDAAQKASRMAFKTLQMQAAAHMSLVREKDAGNPRPAAEAHAKTQVDKATTAADVASRAVSAVKNSKKARDAAAKAAAKAAKAAAKKTKDAQKAYDKQKALCKPLMAAASAAKSKVSTAEAALKKCKTELKSAEAAAPGQARANLQDKLNKAQGRKAGCQRDMDKYARELGKAFKALRLLGVIRPPKEDLKTERVLNDSQEFYGALFATGAAKAANVATFEVFAALDALKAGYGIYKIKNSALTPLSSRFVRSESVKWLTETKGIADNPTEAEAVIKVMEGIISRNGTTNHIREEWKRLETQCKANDEDIKRVQARIDKVGKK